MDFLVFGDDFGAHPSTTQHLVRRFPEGDRVIWIDSIGMRAPRPTVGDLKRIAGRLRASVGRRGPTSEPEPARVGGPKIHVLHPTVAPWHDQRAARAINRQLLVTHIRRVCVAHGIERLHAILSNPLGSYYIDGLPIDVVSYLRLDDYPRLPGVDAEMVGPADEALLASAHLVFATARALLGGPEDARRRYLPQGVDAAHFAAVPLEPPASGRVLGFFGLLAEWLDYELVAAVARACPDWTLEFRGPIRSAPDSLWTLPNVKHLPPLPYAALPGAIAHWNAAWIPFQRSTLTEGVNPLKLREYLAAGLPTASTPLPEVVLLGPDATLVESAADVASWLDRCLADTAHERSARRARMATHDWGARAAALQGAIRSAGARP